MEIEKINSNYYTTTSDNNAVSLEVEQINQINDEPKEIPRLYIIKIFSLLSLVFCFTVMFVVAAFPFSIISIIFNNKSKKLYQNDPTKYTKKSYKQLKKYKIIAVIGLILAILILLASYCYVFYQEFIPQNNISEIGNELNHY